MDVRCEKCQTEYELDEARLKPGGVTVKCTNCGHMFKIRKRAPTNVGANAPAQPPPRPPTGTPSAGAAGATATGIPRARQPSNELTAEGERQWLIRLENGDQKSCRELATLQQWIVANIVTRESLISRTGKTWKRLGDITELAQYFAIADEAKQTRAAKPTGPAKQNAAGTMLGIGTTASAHQGPKAVGGTIIPDDDEIIDSRTTGNYAKQSAPPANVQNAPKTPMSPAAAKTPPMGSGAANPLAATTPVPKRPITQPPPPPAKAPTAIPVSKPAATPAPPLSSGASGPTASGGVPSLKGAPGERSTAAWAKDPTTVKAEPSNGNSGPSGPFGGKIAAIPDEPAFAGRVRAIPSDEASFQTGKVRMAVDDEDDDLPARKGGRSGIAILLMVLLVGAGAAAAVYFLVIKKDDQPGQVATGSGSAGSQGATAVDAGAVVTPLAVDAAPEASPAEAARAELATDDEVRLRQKKDELAAIDEPVAHATRALLITAVVQSLNDRAALVDNKTEADKYRKEATTLLIDAATAAQKAHKADATNAAANLAMAEVLRLQNKSLSAMKNYETAAKAKAGTEWARDVALHDAHVLRREAGKGTPAKLAEALTAFATIDSGDGALEKSGDVRARVQRALILLAQNKPADAKPLVEQVLAAQASHAASRALGSKLDTLVAKSDPLPPEDGGKTPTGGNTGGNTGNTGGSDPTPPVTGDNYDKLISTADKIAESNCRSASDIYLKALEVKPTGIEALVGLGYCHLDEKKWPAAHSRFRSALAISPRYEPALTGVAETYQQQGLKDEAIGAWQAVLAAHPNSAKAKRQLERLQGGGAGGSTGGGEGSGTPTPTPPEGSGTPAPTPTPTPEGSGSG